MISFSIRRISNGFILLREGTETYYTDGEAVAMVLRGAAESLPETAEMGGTHGVGTVAVPVDGFKRWTPIPIDMVGQQLNGDLARLCGQDANS